MSEDSCVTHEEILAVHDVCVPAFGNGDAQQDVDEHVDKEQPIGEQDPGGQIVFEYIQSEPPRRVACMEEKKHGTRDVNHDGGVHGPNEGKSGGHVYSGDGEDVDQESKSKSDQADGAKQPMTVN
jgi:hypothetical protein